MNIPKDKNYPSSAGQCNDCGGHGCVVCWGRGWLHAGHSSIRRCLRCRVALRPNHVAVYCSDRCAMEDA